jgi:hypothetical protein
MLAAAIKADPAIRHAAVVMLTSVGGRSEVRCLEGASIEACLVKPSATFTAIKRSYDRVVKET